MTQRTKPYKILIVDDQPNNLDLLGRRLVRAGYEVFSALSAKQAASEIEKGLPDAILLDVSMPEVSGLEFLAQLRGAPRTAPLPVILVSALSESEDIVAGLQAGANDYVTKPVNMAVLLARLETHLKMANLVTYLENQAGMLKQLAAYDELTGFSNRRGFFDALAGETSRVARYGGYLGVLMIGLDGFDEIDADHGTGMGQRALGQFAERLSYLVRSLDVLGRYGKCEFSVLLIEADLKVSIEAAERIRASIELVPFVIDNVRIPITISIGISAMESKMPKPAATLVAEADLGLQKARLGGRNRAFAVETGEIRRSELLGV